MNEIRLAIGRSDFRNIRNYGCYYVDKTSFINKLVHESGPILFNRPRRFGKSTFLSMLHYFFDIREDSRDLFEGLDVMKDQEAVENWMNKYPVVYFSFQNITSNTFSKAMRHLDFCLSRVVSSYRHVLDAAEDCDEKDIIERIYGDDKDLTAIPLLLSALASLLHKHYGKPVIFILDECDTPLYYAEQYGYYNEMLEVMETMLGKVLKDCPDTKMGILAGCLPIPNESINSRLNNITVYSVASHSYDSAFGFTQEEVARLLKATGLDDKAELLGQHYYGYSIGGAGIYCPWDVLMCVKDLQSDRNEKPRNHWVDTSGNDVIERFLEMNVSGM